MVSSISKKNKNSAFAMLITLIIVMAISFGVIYAVTTFVGIGLMTLIGFEYNSIPAVFLFFFIFVCFTIPLDFISTSILDFVHFKGRIPESFYKVLEFLVEFVLVLLGLLVVDSIMKSISIPFRTKVLFSVLLYVFTSSIEYMFLKDKN